MSDEITSACPSCGTVATRETYDIGSGRELSCANCEWCWGADGQRLRAVDVADVMRWAQTQGIVSAMKSPDCPVCGHPPAFLLGNQAFCGNDDCTCLSWNPTITPAENLAGASKIDVEDE